MRLVFDLSATQHPQGIRHGGGEYSKAVFRCLLRERDSIDVVAVSRSDWPLESSVAKLCSEAGVRIFGAKSIHDFERLIARQNVSRFFSGVPYHFGGIVFGKCEVVFAIHGIRSIELPSDEFESRYASSLGQRLKIAAKQALPILYRQRQRRKMAQLLCVEAGKRTIIVSSHHTKYALLCEFPWLNEKEVQVKYCPRSPVAAAEPAEPDYLESIGLERGRFVLLVSGGRWEKNVFRATRSLGEAISRLPALANFKIAITGGLPATLEKDFRDTVVVLPYTTDRQLARLYRSCMALVYPTLNEGFGYPPLEAMTHGAPVLASAVCSIPEIAGPAAIYFDPRSEIEIRARLLQLVTEPGLRESMVARGLKRAEEISALQDRDLRSVVSILVRT